ncbi:MAG: hypothetical protein NTY36_00320 [Deltaproteobacteria bacterium]|nr:hypothetical protein [Deltaproteobacteria bacterium]
MTWYAAFQCLNCEHSWREPAPADAWEMVCKVAVSATCPLCGDRMDEGQVELLSHSETKIAVLCSAPYIFTCIQ